LDVDHCLVGKAIAEKWSLPPLLAVPIACHHEPEEAGEELAPMARVVHVAWLFSEVFLQKEPAEALLAAKTAARNMLHLEEPEVERLLKKINASTHEIADVLEVQIGERVNCTRLLSEAREALLHMTLQTQRQADALQGRNADLEKAVTIDTLTGLLNRKRFDELLASEFSRARRERGNLCVLFVDVDHFKRVNDTFGHAAGDAVLRNLGSVLQRVTGPTHLAARYGGEEFVVLVPGATLQTGSHLAQTIRQAVEDAPTGFGGRDLPVRVSVGVAVMEGGAYFDDPEQLLTFADRALYAAKRCGRNTVRICPAPQAAAAPK
jgi:diguanylate cyclase (GGDEF)-like protein